MVHLAKSRASNFGPRMITKLHIESWKSFADSTLHIDPLTVLIGLNASGKSNALDAFSFLNRVSNGIPLVTALQGDGTQSGVRGGWNGPPSTSKAISRFRL
jgi:predicted ATPase